MPNRADRRSPLAGEPLSITIDDFPRQYDEGPTGWDQESSAELLTALEHAFGRHPGARPILFVNSDRVRGMSFPIDRLARIGLLGNHTASHCDVGSLPLDRWQDDVLRCQRFIEPFLGAGPRFFRFPYLRTGTSRSARDAAYRFLSESGLIVLPGSCPTADWLLASFHEAAHRAGDAGRRECIERAAISHVVAALENAVLERTRSPIVSAPLVLVLHANRLLTAIIDPLLDCLRRLGASLTDAPVALSSFDRFNRFDRYVGTWGGSFFLQCSEEGCDALAGKQDWLFLECKQLQAEHGENA